MKTRAILPLSFAAASFEKRRVMEYWSILNGSAAVFMSCFHQVLMASVTYWVTLL
jgi:hypothetical protein